MPSSRDAAAVAWEPDDFATAPRPTVVRTATVEPVQASTTFELSPSAGVPDALLSRARENAEQAGYVAGWNRGHRAALQQGQQQADSDRAQAQDRTEAALAGLLAARAALAAAAQNVRTQEIALAVDAEALIVDAALRITETLIGVSLADDALLGRAAVSRALDLAPQGDAVVALSPHDLGLLPADLPADPSVTFVPDAALAPGDAVVRCGATTLDARIGAGLDRVRALIDQSVAR